MPKLLSYSLKLTLTIAILGLFLLYANPEYSGPMRSYESKNILAQASPDTIAIRIIPNPDHYSALRWYQKQGFSGSPQSLIIDGYEAVREGRTVYVNAANVTGSGPSAELYTNIYLLSYNQEAERATISIVNQLLQHWHFNTDLQNIGQCVDAEENLSDVCLIDPECPIGKYCNSDKAKVTRDTRRLADLAEMKFALEEYRQIHQHYPILSSGSYLPNQSISTWPSWQETLAQELGISLPIDPINQLGECEGYDEITCWNEQIIEFADPTPDNNEFNLPDNSNVYIYSTNANGSAIQICGIMESGLITDLEEGACSASAGAGAGSPSVEISEEIGNNAPIFTGDNLAGYSGRPFEGYINAYDPDGDALSWSIDTSFAIWTMWSAEPVLQNTPIENQKKIYAAQAGVAGFYVFTITLDDGRGKANSSVTKDFTVIVSNPPPVIIAEDMTYLASTTNPINYSLTASDDLSNYPLAYQLIQGTIPLDFNSSFDQTGNFFTYAITGILNPNFIFLTQDETLYSFAIDISDSYGAVAVESFNINVLNNAPSIESISNQQIRINNAFTGNVYFFSQQVNAVDPDGHSISYAINNEQVGISINSSSGLISGYPSVAGSYNMAVTVTDVYHYPSVENFNLRVNTFCGDGDWQATNNENIDEQCDNVDNIATLPGASSPTKQYACTADCAYTGGWCGDSTIQSGYGETCDDGNSISGDGCSSACAIESGWICSGAPSVCSFCGDGAIEGNEICDSNSQPCVSIYTAGLPAYCSDITLTGIQTCNSTCTGWNACVASPPTTVGGSSTACNFTNVVLSNYSCCELTSCTRDGCDCCGRSVGANTPAGYTSVQNLSPCVVGDPGDPYGPAFVSQSCRLSQSNSNARNWYATTNHTTINYQCWD